MKQFLPRPSFKLHLPPASGPRPARVCFFAPSSSTSRTGCASPRDVEAVQRSVPSVVQLGSMQWSRPVPIHTFWNSAVVATLIVAAAGYHATGHLLNALKQHLRGSGQVLAMRVRKCPVTPGPPSRWMANTLTSRRSLPADHDQSTSLISEVVIRAAPLLDDFLNFGVP
eukprot:gene17469-biopygen23347